MIGVEVDCPFTPAMLRKVTYAGAQAASFVKATEDLAALAEVDLSRERVQRWTKRIGQERAVQVDRQCEAFLALSLPQQRQSPTDQVPQVACVMMDGGRIQIRDRHSPEPSGSSYWKETLVGCCLSMASASSGEDPCPRIPETFVDPQRIGALSREIKGFSGDTESEAQTPPDTPSERSAPKMLVKSVVATRRGIDTFGQKLAATAYARGFHAAPRKAFVADGSATNWGVHQRHFSHYTPILDFTHAICYVYAAAMAGRTLATAWSDYCRWAQWLWEGDTRPLIEAVRKRLEQLGGPPPGGDETSPAAIVAKTLKYLENQQSRMRYAQYRQQGLPITSSHIESTIKQINQRVKGSEKFWAQGAEPLLQLAADHLSETRDYSQFWQTRSQRLTSTRSYQTAA